MRRHSKLCSDFSKIAIAPKILVGSTTMSKPVQHKWSFTGDDLPVVDLIKNKFIYHANGDGQTRLKSQGESSPGSLRECALSHLDRSRNIPQITEFLRNEGAGTRTQDQRIKSPLLYQLSYALSFLDSDRKTPVICNRLTSIFFDIIFRQYSGVYARRLTDVFIDGDIIHG